MLAAVTETDVFAFPVQPVPSPTVTLYVPPEEATIDAVVAPIDQVNVVPPVAVNVTFSPWQNVVGPLAVIPALIPDPVPILIAIGEDVTGPQSGLGVMV